MFKIGQRVVCVNASQLVPNAPTPPLVLGREYTVHAMTSCRGCGAPLVDVGFSHESYGTICGCGYGFDDFGWVVYASRFAPIEEKSDTMVEDVLAQLQEEMR